MIRAHRQLHLTIFLTLLFALPILFFVGLVLRPIVPPTAAFDPSLRASAGFPVLQEWRPRVMSTDVHQYELQVAGGTGVEEGASLTIRPTTIILKPDLLVYWNPGNETKAQIGPEAVLVGSLSGTSRRLLQLPANAAGGTLVVYSLAHQEIVDLLPLVDFLASSERTKE